MKVRAFYHPVQDGQAKLLAVMPLAVSTPQLFDLLVDVHGDVYHEDYASLEEFMACLDLPQIAVYNKDGFVQHIDELMSPTDCEEMLPCDVSEIPNLKDMHANLSFAKRGEFFYGFPHPIITKRETN